IQTSDAQESKKSAIRFAKSFLRNSNDDDITDNKELLKMCQLEVNNKEADDFIPSPIVESMRLEVSYRLGFTYGLPMIMEYWKDLEHYYEFGYGNKLSEKMGCSLVKDMIEKIS
ncbi:PHOsphatase, partial [Sarracenia purpurea var. burkii]